MHLTEAGPSPRRANGEGGLAELFEVTRLWEASDPAAELRQLAPRVRALAHVGHSKLGAELMDAQGPEGYLINIARGSVVDQPILLRYLQEQRIAGAGLDVYDDEPNVPPEFFALDNAVLLPHVGSASEETRRAMGDLQIENLLLHLSGEAVNTRVV